MTIGIEAERANHPQKTGVEHYAKQLILHLAKIDQKNSYVLYLRTLPQEWFLNLPQNFKVRVIPFPLFWTQIRVSLEMLFNPVDVLLIPASALPLIHPKKSIVTIHDLAWKFYPQAFTTFMRNFLEWSTAFAVKRAFKVIAVSESTKQDLEKFYGIDEKKIIVIHHGCDLDILRASPSEAKSSREELLSTSSNNIKLPDKYILFLSTLQPRKNLEGLIEAFKFLKEENPELPHKLVLAGKPGWKFESILKKIEENKNFVLYLNHINEARRSFLLRNADCLVMPSFYEGFGMPILEAFAAGTPVAASNVSSLPEVAGDAAIYFDPNNVNEIKSMIKALLVDKSLAESLRTKGRKRLKYFSWEKCARQTLEVLTA